MELIVAWLRKTAAKKDIAKRKHFGELLIKKFVIKELLLKAALKEIKLNFFIFFLNDQMKNEWI